MGADPDEFERRLREAKLAALAEFAAGAGHEINNPVATILGRSQQLLRSEEDPAKRRALASIASQALRIRDMIGDLMLFARPPEPEPAWTDLTAVAHEVVRPYVDRARDAGVTLAVEAEREVPVFADRTQIAVALAAVVENGLNAVARGGSIRVRVEQVENVPVVSVIDDGAGFSEADREHAFDPFYSGRQAGRGLGFGLPKAWRVVSRAGGHIEIESRAGETMVRMSLPRP